MTGPTLQIFDPDRSATPTWAPLVGPEPPDWFTSDGCSCSPDRYFSTDLTPACHRHDYAYAIGGSELDRLRADQQFRANLLLCGAPGWLAGIYFRRVRLWGFRHFCYRSPHRRPTRWTRLAEFFSRWWL